MSMQMLQIILGLTRLAHFFVVIVAHPLAVCVNTAQGLAPRRLELHPNA